VDAADHHGPFRLNWESLQKYEAPEWYKDAKFGIFIHWGIYSVPAFGNEWYPRNMYSAGSDEYKHHIATYGTQDKFGYKDFIPMFKAADFNAAAWAQLFQKSGAKYVVPAAEHHDGFAMYDSGVSDWTAAKMGPHRWREAQNSSRNIAPTSCTSIGGSASLRSGRISRASLRSTTTVRWNMGITSE
jgi:alpha-L-fucosidase